MHASIIVLTVACAAAAAPIVVDLTATDLATTFAAQTCAGLMNRNASGAGVYTLMHSEDSTWLSLLEPEAAPPISAASLLTACVNTGVVRGYIRYNFSAQQELVPNLVTLAAVTDSLPLEDGSPFIPNAGALVFDAIVAWKDFRAINATAFVFSRYANSTTTLAKMNPGWDVHDAPLGPWTLKYAPDLSLVDWIVKQRLFNFFLLYGCIPGTEEHALMETIATANAWPRPIAVWGYDDTFSVAGDVFEAETTCVSEHNMGQIASVGVNNLAYFSRAPPITTPLVNAVPRATFNASKTYIAFVVGDGDNLAFVKGSRYEWLQQRLQLCSTRPCFPLLWSMSPHLSWAAPDLLRAFYNQTLQTRMDAFILPPSGHLYSYPSMMSSEDQASFVAATETDAYLLNSSGSVEWEFAGTWGAAISNYLPHYAARSVVNYFVAVNVPYMLPMLEFAADEFFKLIGGSVVLFRPNEWRGTSGGADPLKPFLPDAPTMAARVNGYPRGTVTQIYLTSDGGATLSDYFDLAELLAEHVEIVGNEIGYLAVEAAKQSRQ